MIVIFDLFSFLSNLLSSIDFFSDKSGIIGGTKRTITFVRGSGDLEKVTAQGFMSNKLTVTIGPGLPSDSSKLLQTINSFRSGIGHLKIKTVIN